MDNYKGVIVETERRPNHLSNAELKQIQDFAHLLWLGSGAKVKLNPYKKKPKRLITEEEKEMFWRMNKEDGISIRSIAEIFHLSYPAIAKHIQKKKRELGLLN